MQRLLRKEGRAHVFNDLETLKRGTCRIFNPASDYKLVVAHSNYQAAQEWLVEDEYERVKGQLSAEEVV